MHLLQAVWPAAIAIANCFMTNIASAQFQCVCGPAPGFDKPSLICSETAAQCPERCQGYGALSGVSQSNCVANPPPNVMRVDNNHMVFFGSIGQTNSVVQSHNPSCGFGPNDSRCKQICARFPEGAQRVDATPRMAEYIPFQRCPDPNTEAAHYKVCGKQENFYQEGDCSIEYSAVEKISDTGNEVCYNFKNWSDNRARCGAVTLTFNPPK
jgi:hypothetical protein